MKILGVDPGLLHTGWGVLAKVSRAHIEYVDCGVFSPPSKLSFPLRLKFIYDGLCDIIKVYAPAQVAMEEVFVNMNPESSRKLIMARTAAFLACVNNDLPPYEFSPNTIKKSVTGNGHASKAQIYTMVQKILHTSISKDEKSITSDSLDALAVALTLTFQNYPDCDGKAVERKDALL